jgi:hypothetical protein
MDVAWVISFVTQRCTFGSYRENKIFAIRGVELLNAFHLYLGSNGIYYESSKQEFYKELRSLYINDVYNVRQVDCSRGRKFKGITLNEHLYQAPVVVRISDEERAIANKEYQRQYRQKQKAKKELLRSQALAQKQSTPPVMALLSSVVGQHPVISTVSQRLNLVASLSISKPTVASLSIREPTTVAYQNVTPINLSQPSQPPQATTIKRPSFGGFIPPDPLTPEPSPSALVSESTQEPGWVPASIQCLRVIRAPVTPVVTIPAPVPVLGLTWDGRYLGRLTDEHFILIGEYKPTKSIYFSLKYEGMTAVVTKIQSKDTIPSIIDELKPLFGIPRIGTHSCMMPDGNRYLLRRVPVNGDIDNPMIYHSISLLDYQLTNEALTFEIKRFVTFRELLGIVTPNGNIADIYYDNSIFLLNGRGERTIDRTNATVVSNTIRERWFCDLEEDRPIANFTVYMLKINPGNMANILADLYFRIEEIIERVDRDQIELLDVFKERICSIVMSVVSSEF